MEGSLCEKEGRGFSNRENSQHVSPSESLSEAVSYDVNVRFREVLLVIMSLLTGIDGTVSRDCTRVVMNSMGDPMKSPASSSLLSPWEGEDPAFRREGRLPNLRYGDQVRAVWVTRYDFHSDADIMRIMDRSAQAGFNTVFFQVRGNASAYYLSNLEPWSEVYGWKHPGFDPLRIAINEAHAKNMALHAWINVMPMWKGLRLPTNPDHMYFSHPEWSWYDRHGARQGYGMQPLNTGFYISINPCLPDARKHIVGVCREIVSNYEVDGLHLDYIRFPNEHPVVRGHQYSRDQRTLELYKMDTGLVPDDDPKLWNQWRCDCVTALLRDIQRTAKSLRPQLVLSAAVAVERTQALRKFQDVEKWWKEKLLDAVVPMNYTSCHETFRLRVDRDWRLDGERTTTLPFRTPHNRGRPSHLPAHRVAPVQIVVKEDVIEAWAPLPAPAIIMGTSVEVGDARLHQKQLALALQRFGHFSVFCYSSLFGPIRAAKGMTETPLLLFLRILADASKFFLPHGSAQEYLGHPFRATTAFHHPEEASPYDQLDLYKPLPCEPEPLAKEPENNWVKKKGDRYVAGPMGDIIKLRRRTFRRNLYRKLQKKEDAFNTQRAKVLSETIKTEEASTFKETVEALGPVVAMNNWEALKMLEATAEEGETMDVSPADVFSKNTVVSFSRGRSLQAQWR